MDSHELVLSRLLNGCASEDFRDNPVGAFFDPDCVLAAHKAGATFEQLQKDTYAGMYPPSKPANTHLPPVG